MSTIIERTPSVADALAIAGKTLEQIINPTDSKDVNAYKVITEVIKVLNEDWAADFSNENQRKYEPYFIYRSGFGLSYDDCDNWGSNSGVGVRLCYKNYEVMQHGVEILKEYYNDFLNRVYDAQWL